MSKQDDDVFRPATGAEIRAAIEQLSHLPWHPDTAALRLRFLADLDIGNYQHGDPINLTVALGMLGMLHVRPDADVAAIEAGGFPAFERAIIDPKVLPHLHLTITAIMQGRSLVFYFPTPDELRREIVRIGERPGNEDTPWLNLFVSDWLDENCKRPAAERADLDEFWRAVEYRFPMASGDEVGDAFEWAVAYRDFQAATRSRIAEIEAKE